MKRAKILLKVHATSKGDSVCSKYFQQLGIWSHTLFILV